MPRGSTAQNEKLPTIPEHGPTGGTNTNPPIPFGSEGQGLRTSATSENFTVTVTNVMAVAANWSIVTLAFERKASKEALPQEAEEHKEMLSLGIATWTSDMKKIKNNVGIQKNSFMSMQ